MGEVYLQGTEPQPGKGISKAWPYPQRWKVEETMREDENRGRLP